MRMRNLNAPSGTQLVYVGTYTHDNRGSGRSESIYICKFDASSGTLSVRGVVHDVVNPSFLTLTKQSRFLFTVNERAQSSGAPDGAVSAFAVDRRSGQLSFLNSQSSHGSSPCYVTQDATEKWTLVANYGSGTISVFPIADDGRLGDAAAVIQNRGRSVVAGRQDSPHAHSVIFDPSQRYVLAADLGIDQILVFRFDGSSGQLLPHDPPSVTVAPGAGPRHLEFHPGGRHLFVTNELNSTVSAYAWDADWGTLTHTQTVSSLPDDFEGVNSMADLHATSDGRFLYTSNRGHDSITVLAIEASTGSLMPVEFVSTGGQTPRNFALDLSEHYLLVANQDSDHVIVFARDLQSGRLTPTGTPTAIPSPACVKVVRMPNDE